MSARHSPFRTRTVVITLTAIMTTAALILIAPAATGSTASHRPLHASSYLLALGDSISFGFQSPKPPTRRTRRRSTPATSTSSPAGTPKSTSPTTAAPGNR